VDKTGAELISTHKAASGQISTWEKQRLDGVVLPRLSQDSKALNAAALTASLYEETGRLNVEIALLPYMKPTICETEYFGGIEIRCGHVPPSNDPF